MNHLHPRYRTLVWIGLIASLIILGRQLAGFALHPMMVPVDDFVEYWAAGRLNITGGNPYLGDALLPLQQQVGWPKAEPLMMWNPPWALTLTTLFSLPGYPLGRLLWLAINFAIVFVSADILWRYYGGAPRLRWIGWGLSFAWMPTLVALAIGQISAFILLGAVGFLYFSRRQRWQWAGAAAILMSIKPHLVYLFWLALILWIISERRWRVLLGCGLALITLLAVSLISNHAVISQYVDASTRQPPLYWVTPTFGAALRLLLGEQGSWLQFVPTALGTIWFLTYWLRRRSTWAWAQEMPLLLLVSAVSSSYGWTFDQVVLVVPIIWCAVGLLNRGRRPILYFALLYFVAINGIVLYMRLQQATEFLYLWLAPALLLGYLGVRLHLAAPEKLS
jgi:hypothetical protein